MSDLDSSVPDGFRLIPGFPRYAIDESGTILSVCRDARAIDLPWSEARPLTPATKYFGRLGVVLCRDNRKFSRHVHTLVLTAFVGPRPAGMQCRHLDGNPANNHVNNLKWGTPRENQHDRIAHGTSTRGELNGRAKLKAGDVLEIRRRAANSERHMDIAKDFGVSLSAIERIKSRTSWKHI